MPPIDASRYSCATLRAKLRRLKSAGGGSHSLLQFKSRADATRLRICARDTLLPGKRETSPHPPIAGCVYISNRRHASERTSARRQLIKRDTHTRARAQFRSTEFQYPADISSKCNNKLYQQLRDNNVDMSVEIRGTASPLSPPSHRWRRGALIAGAAADLD